MQQCPSKVHMHLRVFTKKTSEKAYLNERELVNVMLFHGVFKRCTDNKDAQKCPKDPLKTLRSGSLLTTPWSFYYLFSLVFLLFIFSRLIQSDRCSRVEQRYSAHCWPFSTIKFFSLSKIRQFIFSNIFLPSFFWPTVIQSKIR